MSKVIVVGGGPAGMMAAYSAASIGHEVLLLERNEKLGKKMFITGKGRCNFTNASDMNTIQKNVIHNPRFLYSAFAAYNNQDVMNFIKDHGCDYKVERGNRVFPLSDHSWDVINACTSALKEMNVEVRLNTHVKELVVKDGCCKGVKTAYQTLMADSVIIATGGLAYPSTGSTGDGYTFAKRLGIEVTDCQPALVPFTTAENWVQKVSGLTLKNVGVTLQKDGKTLYTDFGEMSFLPYGVSGPTLLSASSIVGHKLPVQLYIDLKPALSYEQLDARILRDFAQLPNETIQNALVALLPGKMIQIVLMDCQIPFSKAVHDITREERMALLNSLKKLPLTLNGLRNFNEAIITQGGISVKEIKPGSMECKKIKDLYFVGEVLDVDALTGGYNMQIAFSTGYLAGQNIEYK